MCKAAEGDADVEVLLSEWESFLWRMMNTTDAYRWHHEYAVFLMGRDEAQQTEKALYHFKSAHHKASKNKEVLDTNLCIAECYLDMKQYAMGEALCISLIHDVQNVPDPEEKRILVVNLGQAYRLLIFLYWCQGKTQLKEKYKMKMREWINETDIGHENKERSSEWLATGCK